MNDQSVSAPSPTGVDSLSALARLRQAVWVFDIDQSRVHWANAAALELWSAESLEALIDREMGTEMSPAVAHRLKQYQFDFSRDSTTAFTEVWTLYPAGQPLTLHVVFSGFRLPDGRMGMFCEALQQHVMDAESLRSAEALLHTSVMITLYDTHGCALYRNPAARTVALTAAECLSERFCDRDAEAQLTAMLADKGTASLVARVHTNAGIRWHDVTARRCVDAVSASEAWLISEVDVTSLKKTEEHAQFLAEHDTLTNLPNRNYVVSDFRRRLRAIRDAGQQGAMIFIDLDHFKHVNDSLGHAAGDELLVATANRLRNIVQSSDVVARLGGDEFLVLVMAPDVSPRVRELSKQIKHALARPVSVCGREVRVTPSLGVSLFPDDGDDVETLMRHADLAMYEAKANGRNTFAFFTPKLTNHVRSRLALESELRRAMEEQQFAVHFQPRVCVRTDVIVGAEALVRWNHPKHGTVSPSVFIPVCEDCGLIGHLGEFVFEQAALQQAEWCSRGYDLRISVNLSPRQFADPNLLATFVDIVSRTGARAQRIEVEITESVLLGHDKRTIDVLEKLRAAGFRIAIDDFGTGYSNLAYLHRYPLTCLKIDRSFITALDNAPPIAELIVSMSKLLKLEMVAEGVETITQLHWLRDHGCQEYQGYLFAKPMPADAFTDMLRSRVNALGGSAVAVSL